MKRKSPFIVEHGSYPYSVMVCVGHSHDEVIRAIEKRNGGGKLSEEIRDSLNMEGIGRTVMLPGGQTVIRVENLKNKADFHANLAHEILHAVSFLFDRVGLPYSLDGDEAWAYQVGHVTREIYKNL